MMTCSPKLPALLTAALLSLTAVPDSASARDIDGVWRGKITCEGRGKPWVSERTARINDGNLLFVHGRVGKDGFETWQGPVSADGEVIIHGRYRWKRTKYIWMKGRVKGRSMILAGQRGPRRCTLKLSKMKTT